MKSTRLWVCAICIGILLLVLTLRKRVAAATIPLLEGFQYKTLNVPYANEVFLVGDTDDSPTPDYRKGVLFQDAQNVCLKYGATLASKQQLKNAIDASANWCRIGGWVADDSTHLYYAGSMECTFKDPCDDEADGTVSTRKSCARKIPLPPSSKGFVNCYGVKPPLDMNSSGVHFFNRDSYSILDTPAVVTTMSAPASTDTTDMIPYSFTASQALWALEQTHFQTVDAAGKNPARTYLRANINTVNTTIRDTVDPATKVTNEDLAAWQNTKGKSCEVIVNLRTDITQRLTALKQLIAAVEGRTKGVFYAKQENMDFQREIAYICAATTAAQSPACSRLATIDFDLFFKPNTTGTGIDTKVLGDLQDLNYNLRLQECTIQIALGKLQILSDYLACPAPDASTLAFLGDYKLSANSYYPPTCKDLANEGPEWAAFTGANEKRFTIGKNIGYVSVESLRVAFEELSPFFQTGGYSAIMDNILQYLSILIRIPDLNDYASSDANLQSISDRVGAVVSSVTAFFS